MKKWVALLLCLALLIALCGCGVQEQPATTEMTTVNKQEDGIQIGICMPDLMESHWMSDGEIMKLHLEALGYTVFLEDAKSDATLQAEQVKAMVSRPVDCLVVGAVDSIALADGLQAAERNGIPVIAYERMLMNNSGVSGYVGYDCINIGVDIAHKIVEEKALDTALAEGRSHTIEFFMGEFANNNAVLFYQGIMQVLQSYFDSGVLVSPSGRTLFEDTCTAKIDQEQAQMQCAFYLKEYYKGSWPEILVTADDILADGCVQALRDAQCPAESWPLITGQKAGLDAVRRIIRGEQLLTTYYDTVPMAQACAEMVLAALQGEDLGFSQSSNGEKDVPADFFLPELVHMENYEKILVGAGVYTKEILLQS